MTANNYTLSPKSKSYHALDSFVYEYTNSGGVKDNLKIEINYMLRKCAVIYSAIGAEQPPAKFELNHIGNISVQQIKRELNPVLRKGEKFDLEVVRKEVKKYLASIMIPTKDETMFWQTFANGTYSPELVFKEGQELQNILHHPMALWKCRKQITYK